MVTAESAALAGLPVILPLVESSSRPTGRDPETNSQVYGISPPSAPRVYEYANSAVPDGRLKLVSFRVERVTGSEALPPQPARKGMKKRAATKFDTCIQGIISPGREAREGRIQNRIV